MAGKNDPAKQTQDTHSAMVTVAKAIGDAYYKVDDAMLKLPVGSEIAPELKAVRDNLFVQKQRVETLVAKASDAVQALPPEMPEPEPAPEPAAPQAPAAAPTASVRVEARTPTVQCQKVYDLTVQGRPGQVGNLSTDGKVISLHGNPIFYIENGEVFASWAGWPTMTTAANVNTLATLAGIPGRPFSFKDRQPMVNGQPVLGALSGWQKLGTLNNAPAPTPVAASKRAGTPSLLLPRPK